MAKIKIRNRNDNQPAADPNANYRPQSILDTYADSRDFLSRIVGGGHTSLGGNVELQNQFHKLSSLVGAPMAQKLTSQALLFNQRPDAQRLPLEEKVKQFYALGSNDPEVASFMNGAGSLGMGPVHGFRNSTLIGNSVLQDKSFTRGSVADVPTPKKILVKRK